MKRIWVIVLLLSLGLNVGLGLNLLRRSGAAPPSPERHGVHRGPHGPEITGEESQPERFLRRRLDRLGDELHLDEQQRSAFWTLHREAGPEIFARRSALMDARHHLHDVYDDDDLDTIEIRRATRQLSALQTELDSLVVDVMLRERSILTPEQRLEYRQFYPLGRERGERRYPGRLDGSRRGGREVQ